MTLTLEVRDADLARAGVLDDYSKCTVVLRHNAPDTVVLDMATTVAAELLDLRAGLIVKRGGEVLTSAAVLQPTRKLDKGAKTTTLQLIGDTDVLAGRLARPSPLGALNAAEYDVRSGPAETVLRGYVDANAGPGALAARRVAGLALQADLARGAQVTERARFGNLLELCQAIGLAGGLGFRVVWAGAGVLQLQLYVPADRSDSAVFSQALGNLAGYDYGAKRPTATAAVVGGGGELTARVLLERVNAAEEALYGVRREVFVDQRQTVVQAELEAAGDAALLEGVGGTSLTMTPTDTEAVAFGREYGLGDLVTVVVDGVTVVDLVREVTVEQTATGETVRPTVGTPGGARASLVGLFSRMQQLAQRVGQLERR